LGFLDIHAGFSALFLVSLFLSFQSLFLGSVSSD
jgi:hypothetical protein